YQVRFENATSAATRIKFETEGVLLRQLTQNTALDGIQALIFDEFHERHLWGDVTLACALDIQERRRPDLLILVMSATLDAAALEPYLAPCSVVRSEGRMFPVEVEYLPRRAGPTGPPVWELAADAFAARADADGDALVFMPGGYEINRTLDAIRQRPESRGRLLFPLHGELPADDQDAAVARHDRPKVVVATNVAETSITIDGVRLVIDSGLARIPRYDPHRGINTLLVERIARSSAEQRAGRAGRTAPGRCVRLWSKAEHDERAAQELPEIQRLDISEAVLTLKACGHEDLRRFRWFEAPRAAALDDAEELLVDLGALEPASRGGAVTPMGRQMLAFPLHPRYARMLLAASEYNCVREACLVAALTQGRDLLERNPSPTAAERREELWSGDGASDFERLMSAWRYAAAQRFQREPLQRAGIHAGAARQTGALYQQFLGIARSEGLPVEAGEPAPRMTDALRQCILIAFSDRVGRRVDEGTLRCELVHGRRGVLARESAARQRPLLVFAEVREVDRRKGDVNTVLSLATGIEPGWLQHLFPEDVMEEQSVTYDSATRRVEASRITRFRGLALSSRKIDPPADAAARALADEIAAGRLQLPLWDHAVEQWILRLNLLAVWRPELGLPPLGAEDRRHIFEQICLGATSYKDLKDRPVASAVRSWLSGAQREILDKYAPERVKLSNGRTPKVTYVDGGPPFIALRIQELFGVTACPRIALGSVAISVHILAPSMRPVQVTEDLESFWRESYPQIKPALQRKYPKHEWR
ncbi:MAG TPA: ATP-dependent helicase HrpB, partial [Terriglobia bacterium]|nr:ATP-dependent helicase HrpB [Terriglobia bacterium]